MDDDRAATERDSIFARFGECGHASPDAALELSSEMATPSIFVVSRPKQPEHATPDGAVIENA